MEFILAVIEVVMIVDMDIGLKISDTIPLAIPKQELMLMGYMHICIRTDTIAPINQVAMVDF